MNKQKYMDEIYLQLADGNVYKKVDSDPLASIQQCIANCVLDAMEAGIVDDDLKKFLIKDNPITPILYTLPKIHKNLENPPGRPIVAGTDSVLSPLAVFLDKILQPLVQNTNSFVKDTTHLLNILDRTTLTNNNVLLVSLDVSSLYTSINHDTGISAVTHFLNTTEYTEEQKSFLVDLLQIVLHQNYFLFGDNFYIQQRGTVMGSNVAPSYANLYMAHIEEEVIYKNSLFRSHCTLYLRYIDDLLLIWDGDLESLNAFHHFLNGIEETLKFTMDFNPTSINFLDVKVVKDGNILKTELYRKVTDKNNLLHFASFHPDALKNSLPYSQFMRVKRIVSDSKDCDFYLKEMVDRFGARGYSKQILKNNLEKVHQQTRQELLIANVPKHKDNNRIAFVSRYNTASKQIGNIIRKHWHLLQSCLTEVPSFQLPPMLAYKRARNLKDRLVKADVGSLKSQKCLFLQRPKFGTFPCLHCCQCNSIIKGNTFNHPHSGKQYKIKQYYTCESTYVVYLLKCPCGLLYIGETTQRIRDRISKHKSTIRTGQTSLPVPAHFRSAGHAISQLKFQIIDSVPVQRRGGNRLLALQKLEMQWIHRLDTVWPRGLNKDYTPSMFIYQ
ncbi:uncharacterized protein LOC121397711 [Xenopus laevis]|uniref:Uncharacterized protein LOC121397711 n=1 Tax=Xenopus laevis TaxID=8355 RepID=A0A8J1LQ87_XENLA|nr:uncharacterized protein LOC121397711 [Xenopus laevis]